MAHPSRDLPINPDTLQECFHVVLYLREEHRLRGWR